MLPISLQNDTKNTSTSSCKQTQCRPKSKVVSSSIVVVKPTLVKINIQWYGNYEHENMAACAIASWFAPYRIVQH